MPELPEIKVRARKRDVSFGSRTEEGKKAWNTFMSLAATAKKLGASFYQYIHGRVTKTYKIPPLADLIWPPALLLSSFFSSDAHF